MYEAGIGAVLPQGIRGRPCCTTCAERVTTTWVCGGSSSTSTPAPWSLDDFTRTAYLLGRLAARRAEGKPVNDSLPEICHLPWPTPGLRLLRGVSGAGRRRAGVPGSGQLWQAAPVETALQGVGQLRPAPTISADSLTGCRRCSTDSIGSHRPYAHGDASPQNLLIPRTWDRTTRIVIDWGLEKLLPIGFDLGQLPIGLAHADQLPAAALPTTRESHRPRIPPRTQRRRLPDRPVARARRVLSAASSAGPHSRPSPFQPQRGRRSASHTMVNRIRLSRYLVDLAATPWLS